MAFSGAGGKYEKNKNTKNRGCFRASAAPTDETCDGSADKDGGFVGWLMTVTVCPENRQV